MNIIDMWQEVDGVQDVRFFEHSAEFVLLADYRLKGCSFIAFKEYKNANRDSILGLRLGGHAHGSVSFQIAHSQAR